MKNIDSITLSFLIIVIVLLNYIVIRPLLNTLQPQKIKESWLHKRENLWMLVGAVIAVAALSIPFILMYFSNVKFLELLQGSTNNQGAESSSDLLSTFASMGDFFGGTTVGLLSLASIIFVVAAISMQKEELALQRKELSKTRDEYIITNATMRKQQFDSTFFSMINLHHNIINDISIDDISNNNQKGRKGISELISRLKHLYNGPIRAQYIKHLKEEMKQDDNINKVKDYLLIKHLEPFMYIIEERYNERINQIVFYDNEEYNLERIKARESREAQINQTKEQFDLSYQSKTDRDELINKLNFIDFVKDNNFCENEYVKRYNQNYKDNPLIEFRMQAFEMLYEENEGQLGHYFRNLYHIVKLIKEEEFSEVKEENDRERSKYIAILRAQISKDELLLLFYNVVYSNKGKKFKDLLKGTYFFDDHLNSDDFIWPNDIDVLQSINS